MEERKLISYMSRLCFGDVSIVFVIVVVIVIVVVVVLKAVEFVRYLACHPHPLNWIFKLFGIIT